MYKVNPPEVFLGKGVMKICSNLQENTHAEVWRYLNLEVDLEKGLVN